MEKHHVLLGLIKALLVLTPIFGLTWGLGLATLLEKVSVVPHYTFTILNTSQVGENVVAVLSVLLDGLSPCQSLLREAWLWSRNIGSGTLESSGLDPSSSTDQLGNCGQTSLSFGFLICEIIPGFVREVRELSVLNPVILLR